MNARREAIKPGIRAMHGYTLVQPQCAVKLNQNECPFDVPEAIKREILDEALARNWGRYPDFVPTDVKVRLGARHGLGPDHILVGNGSNELIQAVFLAAVSAGDRVVVSVPTFTLYGLMNTAMEGDFCPVLLRKDLTFDTGRLLEESARPDTRMVVLCSPNNPTGSLLLPEDIGRIAGAASGLVVVDEAYFEFGGTTALGLLDRHPNLVVTRTFSKALGAAGLRIGYLIAHPDIAREIEKVKLPYNVNLISLIATRRLLEEQAMIDERAAFIRSERQRVFEHLRTIPGITPYPSAANFILFETDRPVKEVFRALIDRGILIRDVSHYPMLEQAMRVTVGAAEENDAFLAALEAVMGNE
jgi:histidinol-phosphate aminotransferase